MNEFFSRFGALVVLAILIGASEGAVAGFEFKFDNCQPQFFLGTYHRQPGQNDFNPGVGGKCYLTGKRGGLYAEAYHIFRNSQSRSGQDRSADAFGIGYDLSVGRVWDREILFGLAVERIRYETFRGKVLTGNAPILDLIVRDKAIDYIIGLPAMLPAIFGKQVDHPFAEVWFLIGFHSNWEDRR